MGKDDPKTNEHMGRACRKQIFMTMVQQNNVQLVGSQSKDITERSFLMAQSQQLQAVGSLFVFSHESIILRHCLMQRSPG